MLNYSLKCKKDTENANLKVIKTENGRAMLYSKCAVYGNKKIKIYKRTRRKRIIK